MKMNGNKRNLDEKGNNINVVNIIHHLFFFLTESSIIYISTLFIYFILLFGWDFLLAPLQSENITFFSC